jgi:lipopolysaccharide biosynthesis regulator YciM
MKIINQINRLANYSDYLLVLTPILLTSFYLYGSKYPAWANTLFIASILSFIFTITLIVNYKKNGEENRLGVFIVLSSIIFLAYSLINSKSSLTFNLFGKGIEEWRVVGIILFFTSAAYFITRQGRLLRFNLYLSGATIVYTVGNYFLIKYNLNIANYTAYLNVPMLSFSKLINFPFVYSLTVFISSLIAIVLERFDYSLGVIRKKLWYMLVLILISLLTFVMLYRDILRYIASGYYYKASVSYNLSDLESAKTAISRAIVIAPFDEYYLARVEVTNAMINKFLANNSSTTAATSNLYKDYVSSAIDDAMKAVQYDPRSARNYMMLGNAYERSILLSSEDGYKNALAAYEKARSIASDKDYVDVVKAKLSLGTGKDDLAEKYLSDALNFNPQSPIALFTSSQYQASKNNLTQAISYGEQAVRAAPDAIDARLSLGMLYLENKDYNKAVDMLGNALSISRGQNIASIYYLAVAYAKAGDKSNLQAAMSELAKRIDKNSQELEYLRSELRRLDGPAILEKESTDKKDKKEE